MLKSVTSIS